ncbi:MAG: hypothetical protein Q9168_004128 [Polycauliona sp. 1 TL-2023]
MQLAQALFSTDADSTNFDVTGISTLIHPFMSYLEHELQERVEHFYQPVLDYCCFSPTANKAQSMIEMVKKIAAVMRDPKERFRGGREISINLVLNAISTRNGTDKTTSKVNPPTDVKQGMFSLLGFLTMLFDIPRDFSDSKLKISRPQDPYILCTEKPLIDTAMPLGTLLANFGVFIPAIRKKPKKSILTWPRKQPDSVDLNTSVLNAHALIKFAKLNIECIMELEDQPEPLLADANRSMFREALISYRLLFGQDFRSRRLFNSQEKKRASKGGNIDHLLVQLCGHSKSISKMTDDKAFYEQAFYDSVIDFPHYGRRLEVLQTYVSARKPRNVRDVWYDRRDPEKWILIWIFLILTVVTILLSLVQIGLGACQVRLAQIQVRLAELSLVQS